MTLGPHTWTLVTRYATKLQIGVDDAARILLAQIEALISMGSAPWLSGDWLAVLQERRAEGPPGLAGVDLSILHKSTRTRSGFVGVYANGSGFRATGRTGEYLGTFQSAEIAAHRRFTHYKQHGLPYGELEAAVDEMRRQGEQGTDDELRALVLETAKHTGTLHHYTAWMTAEEVKMYAVQQEAQPQMLGFEPGALEAAQAKLEAQDAADEAVQPKRRGRRKEST